MKKILLFAVLLAFCQTAVLAQKEKAVKESEVPARYVKDFVNQVKDAKQVVWTMSPDSAAYMASYVTKDDERQAMRFTQKNTETRYFVESQYYPHAVVDSVRNLYPKHKIAEVYIRNLKGKMTYQVRIARFKGLFCKKETEAKQMSFETNGKLIEVIDQL